MTSKLPNCLLFTFPHDFVSPAFSTLKLDHFHNDSFSNVSQSLTDLSLLLSTLAFTTQRISLFARFSARQICKNIYRRTKHDSDKNVPKLKRIGQYTQVQMKFVLVKELGDREYWKE